MKNQNSILTIALLTGLFGCISEPKKILDPGPQSKRPLWVESSKVTWTEGDTILIRAQYTVRGDVRINGCYQLARLDAKELILREISEEIRGEINNAQQSLSESAEEILTQSKSSIYGGRITGLRFAEQFHERYTIDSIERIDCFVLAHLKRSEYENIRRTIIYKIAEVDPELKRAIRDRQIEFFKTIDDSTKEKGAAGSSPESKPQVIKAVPLENNPDESKGTLTQSPAMGERNQ